ncbi:hypothetical protein LLH00_07025 [bacterium]|nr:hypothetical protein [bacterium]
MIKKTVLSLSVLVLAGLGALLLGRARIPYRVKGPCLFVAQAEWSLLQPQPETLLTRLRLSNPPGISHLRFMQFDRTDFVTFSLDPAIRLGAPVHRDEVIGVLQSTGNRIGYEELSGEVSQARASLTSLRSGQKASLQERALQGLLYSRQALHDFMPTWKRKKELVDKGLIAAEEFELSDAQKNLLEANVALAESDLRTARTGEKPEALDLAAKKIDDLETRLRTWDQKLSALQITAPFDGLLSGPVDSMASIFTLSKLDTLIVEIPVEARKLEFLSLGAPVRIKVFDGRERVLETEIAALDRSPLLVCGRRMYLARVCIANPGLSLLPGLTGLACIECGNVDLGRLCRSWLRELTWRLFI